MIAELEHPLIGRVGSVGNPIRMADAVGRQKPAKSFTEAGLFPPSLGDGWSALRKPSTKSGKVQKETEVDMYRRRSKPLALAPSPTRCSRR